MTHPGAKSFTALSLPSTFPPLHFGLAWSALPAVSQTSPLHTSTAGGQHPPHSGGSVPQLLVSTSPLSLPSDRPEKLRSFATCASSSWPTPPTTSPKEAPSWLISGLRVSSMTRSRCPRGPNRAEGNGTRPEGICARPLVTDCCSWYWDSSPNSMAPLISPLEQLHHRQIRIGCAHQDPSCSLFSIKARYVDDPF